MVYSLKVKSEIKDLRLLKNEKHLKLFTRDYRVEFIPRIFEPLSNIM